LTRLPIREESSSRIAGLVNLKTSLFRTDFEPQKTAGDYLQSAVFLDESMRLEVALRRLQRTGQRMAIVLGQNREEIGIITLEDILSFVFGEVNLA
jgi:CBS domain containing-hemolysin-like protein